jgi:hypothetical protein
VIGARHVCEGRGRHGVFVVRAHVREYRLARMIGSRHVWEWRGRGRHGVFVVCARVC